ncbi:hypothetical protein Tco_1357349, partial [Tanacetum coccineum]
VESAGTEATTAGTREAILEDAIWKLPHQQQILNWRYFHSCSVHCLTVEAVYIYMLTEVKYPLPPRVCKAMLEKKLLGDRKDESTMSNRHKDWLVHEQMALGKDFLNPFMADNLPKTNSDNSYLRDISGDILGKDMHYPFTRL